MPLPMFPLDPHFLGECVKSLIDNRDRQSNTNLRSHFGDWGGVSGRSAILAGINVRPPSFACIVNGTLIIGVNGVQTFVQGVNTYRDSYSEYEALGNSIVADSVVNIALDLLSQFTSLFTGGRQRIFLVGHSLGGMVAEAMGAILARNGVPPELITTITFGSPRPGDTTFQRLCGHNGIRYMNLNDPMPCFPWHSDEIQGGVVYLAVLGNNNGNQLVHPFLGCSIDLEGKYTFQPLPRVDNSTAGYRVVQLSNGNDSVGVFAHSLEGYAQSFTLSMNVMDSTVAKIGVATPDATLSSSLIPVGLKGDVIGNDTFLRIIAMAAYIPPQFVFRVAKITGAQYQVTWMGFSVTGPQTRSNAHAIAKWGNKWLRVLGTAPTILQTNFVTAFNAFATASMVPGNGFNPPFPFVP